MAHGKSTLIKIILGKDLEYQGEIKLSHSVKIGYIPQEIKFEMKKKQYLTSFQKNIIKAKQK